MYFEATASGCAPSFLDIADAGRPADRRAQLLQELPDDRLAPGLAGAARRRMAPALAKLIEFNTSCAPVFVQRAGLAALAQRRRPSFPAWWRTCKACRDTLLPRLQALPGRRGRAAAGRHVRLLPRRRAATTRWRSPSAWSPRPASAWRRARLRRRRARLAALVLRLARPGAAESRASTGWPALPRGYNFGLLLPRQRAQHGAGRFHRRSQVRHPKPQHRSDAGARFHTRKRDARHHRTQGRDRQGQRPRRQRHRHRPKCKSPC